MVLRPGSRVLVGDDIDGIVEEVVFGRGMMTAMYLVEWWQDGDLRARRFHAADVRPKEDPAHAA